MAAICVTSFLFNFFFLNLHTCTVGNVCKIFGSLSEHLVDCACFGRCRKIAVNFLDVRNWLPG